MLEEIYLFSRGLLSFSYTVPIPIQIGAYLALMIIITALVYVFKDDLAGDAYRDTYMWYYFIAVFNILNICAVLYYYHTRTGRFIGAPGAAGDAGAHGKRGDNISCSLCTQNIYLQATQGYDMVTELDFVRLADIVVGADLAKSLGDMDAAIGGARTEFFDFSQLGTNLAAGTFDFTNPLVNNLLLLSTYGDYSLIQYINQVLGLAIPGGIVGTIERPARKFGHFALGDISFGGQEKYSATAYMANGDIRCPDGFDPICSFATAKGKEGRLEYYTIYKPRPPTLTKDDIQAAKLANDISRQPIENQYLSLGHIAYPMLMVDNSETSSAGAPDPLLFACVKANCCVRVSTDKLRFVCVYPGVSGITQPKAIAKQTTQQVAASNTPETIDLDILAAQQTETGNPEDTPASTPTVKLTDRITEKRTANEGYFSIWRTPINTMVVKFSNSVWEDGLLLPEIMYEAAESIYDDDGTIRAQIRTKIEAFLTKIKLDQIIVATILFGATLDQVRVNLRVFVNRFCSGSNAEILGTPALRSAVSKEGMTPQQVSQALKDIKQAIDDTDNKVKPKSATTRKQLSTLFADQKSRAENKKPGEISYNCRQEYNKLTKLIGRLTARIENARNLWDVILAVLPQGLTQRIYKSQLTETQSRLIDLITVLVPPVEDIWMIKDECLVLERPDTTRQEWEAELEKEISAHKKLVRQVNKTSSTNEKEEQETTLCADLDKVNSTIRESMRLIGEQIGHIPDYMGRLNRGDFTELTPNQLKMVLGIFRQTNDKISSNCSANT
jgi:truncated hemoglobin YjbI